MNRVSFHDTEKKRRQFAHGALGKVSLRTPRMLMFVRDQDLTTTRMGKKREYTTWASATAKAVIS